MLGVLYHREPPSLTLDHVLPYDHSYTRSAVYYMSHDHCTHIPSHYYALHRSTCLVGYLTHLFFCILLLLPTTLLPFLPYLVFTSACLPRLPVHAHYRVLLPLPFPYWNPTYLRLPATTTDVILYPCTLCCTYTPACSSFITCWSFYALHTLLPALGLRTVRRYMPAFTG